MRPRRAPRCPATRPGARAGADGRSARLAARLVRDGCSASPRRRRLGVAGAAAPASRARTRDHDGGGGVAQAEQSRARHPPADTPIDNHSSNCPHFPARARAWLPWRWRGLARAADRRSLRIPTRRQSDREGLFVSTLAHLGLGSHSCERATTGATAASSMGRTRSSARRHGAERAAGCKNTDSTRQKALRGLAVAHPVARAMCCPRCPHPDGGRRYGGDPAALELASYTT